MELWFYVSQITLHLDTEWPHKFVYIFTHTIFILRCDQKSDEGSEFKVVERTKVTRLMLYGWVGKTRGIHRYGPEFDAHVFGCGSGSRQNGVVAGQILHRYPRFRAIKRDEKRKFVKSGRSSVVLCTHYPPYISMQSVAYRGTDPGPVFRNLAVCILQYAHLHNLLFSEYNGRLVSNRWLQLVATPVKYKYNSIENISTLS